MIEYNYYIFAAGLAYIIAAVIKQWLYKKEGKKMPINASGGMPSKHSAVSASVAAVALFFDGMGSAAFGISLVFAVIVMYDAMNTRRAVGENRKAIIDLYARHPRSRQLSKDDDVLSTYKALGHYPKEVIAGAGIGVAVAFAMWLIDSVL